MNFGFTCTRKGMSPRQRKLIHHFLLERAVSLKVSTSTHAFHHGDCIGADVEAAEIAYQLCFRVICHPPSRDIYRGFFKFNSYTHPPASYLVRNRHIIDSAELILATPCTYAEAKRGSGTWAAIRYAREKMKPLLIITPEGEIRSENCESLNLDLNLGLLPNFNQERKVIPHASN